MYQMINTNANALTTAMRHYGIQLATAVLLSCLILTVPVAAIGTATPDNLAQETQNGVNTPSTSSTQTATNPPVEIYECDETDVGRLCYAVVIGPEDTRIVVKRNSFGATLRCNPSQTECDQFEVEKEHFVQVNPSPDNPYTYLILGANGKVNGLHGVGDVEVEAFAGHVLAPESFRSIPIQFEIRKVSTDATGNVAPVIAHLIVYHHKDSPTGWDIEFRYAVNDIDGVIYCNVNGCSG